MPLFEYMCSKCGHEFEEIVNAGSVPRCPQCESAELRKKFSGFAVGKGGGAKTSAASSAPASFGGG